GARGSAVGGLCARCTGAAGSGVNQRGPSFCGLDGSSGAGVRAGRGAPPGAGVSLAGSAAGRGGVHESAGGGPPGRCAPASPERGSAGGRGAGGGGGGGGGFCGRLSPPMRNIGWPVGLGPG